jgi:protein gp37
VSDNTKIEWSDATWNPITGCTEVSPGCDHCYAKTFAERWRGTPGHHFENGFDLTLRPERLDQPLRWKKPRRIFVNSMSDLFHDGVPNEFIAKVFAVMALAQQHTFQVLTKRHGRMRSLLNSPDFYRDVRHCLNQEHGLSEIDAFGTERFPLPNVWLGVSVEDQKRSDIRIPALLDTPVAVRFLSCEPLLGPVDLSAWLPRPFERQQGGYWLYGTDPHGADKRWMSGPAIGWCIVGGESGPGARPMDLAWVESIVGQCTATGVPVHVKQLGSVWARASGADPKGGDWWLWPESLRIRRFPESRSAGRTWDQHPAVSS